MSDRIAIQASSPELWRKVKAKIDRKRVGFATTKKWAENIVIYPDSGNWDYTRDVLKCRAISAQDYLKEGEVEEDGKFEGWNIPPNNLCEKSYGFIDERNYPCESVKGFNVSDDCPGADCKKCIIHMGAKDSFRRYMDKQNKPKSKESKMKSNDINNNVKAVFGKESGDDLLLVDKHFDSDMMERILMEKHKAAILKACKEAEVEANSERSARATA